MDWRIGCLESAEAKRDRPSTDLLVAAVCAMCVQGRCAIRRRPTTEIASSSVALPSVDFRFDRYRRHQLPEHVIKSPTIRSPTRRGTDLPVPPSEREGLADARDRLPDTFASLVFAVSFRRKSKWTLSNDNSRNPRKS